GSEYARLQEAQLKSVAAYQGKVFNPTLRFDASESCSYCINLCHVAPDFDRLSGGADFEADVHSRVLINLQSDAALHEFPEPGILSSQVVGAYGDKREQVESVAVCLHSLCDVRLAVGEGRGGSDDH